MIAMMLRHATMEAAQGKYAPLVLRSTSVAIHDGNLQSKNGYSLFEARQDFMVMCCVEGSCRVLSGALGTAYYRIDAV